jgi:hypothetical protein
MAAGRVFDMNPLGGEGRGAGAGAGGVPFREGAKGGTRGRVRSPRKEAGPCGPASLEWSER